MIESRSSWGEFRGILTSYVNSHKVTSTIVKEKSRLTRARSPHARERSPHARGDPCNMQYLQYVYIFSIIIPPL